MSTDVNFLNVYTETLYENFDAIVKQNVMIQTRIKIAEKELTLLADAKVQVGTLTDENRELKSRVEQLQALTSSYKNVADDKSRLQSALNENSQVTNSMVSELNDTKQELVRLKNQVSEIAVLRKENADMKKTIESAEQKDVVVIKSQTKKQSVKATAGTF